MNPTRLPISTVLLTKNSIGKLPAFFKAMDFVDNIVVLDGYSTDDTKEYAAQFSNCQIHDQPKKFLDEHGYIHDFGGLRNYGDSLAKHPWILVVDSDETIDEKCRQSIEKIIKKNSPGVFLVKIKRQINKKDVYTAFPSKSIRLYHKEAVNGWIKKIHERIQPTKDAFKGEAEGYLLCDCEDNSMKKNRRYINLELKSLRRISYRTWFYWVLWFNIKAIGFEIFRTVFNRLAPKPGARMPLNQTFLFIHYHVSLTIQTCPLWRTKFPPEEATA